jgi:hypothetical protein
MCTDMGELMGLGAASQDSPIFDYGLSRNPDIADEYAMIADSTVMGDVYI